MAAVWQSTGDGAGFAHGAPPRPVPCRGDRVRRLLRDRGQSGFAGGSRADSRAASRTYRRGGVAVPRRVRGAWRCGEPERVARVPRGGTMTLGDTDACITCRRRRSAGTRDRGANAADRPARRRPRADMRRRARTRPRAHGVRRTYSGLGRIAPGTGTAVPRAESRTPSGQRFDRSAVPGYQRQPGATYRRSQPGYERQPLPPSNAQRPLARAGTSARRCLRDQRLRGAVVRRTPSPSYQRQPERDVPALTGAELPAPGVRRRTTGTRLTELSAAAERDVPALTDAGFQRQASPRRARPRQHAELSGAEQIVRSAPSVPRQGAVVERAAPQAQRRWRRQRCSARAIGSAGRRWRTPSALTHAKRTVTPRDRPSLLRHRSH